MEPENIMVIVIITSFLFLLFSIIILIRKLQEWSKMETQNFQESQRVFRRAVFQSGGKVTLQAENEDISK